MQSLFDVKDGSTRVRRFALLAATAAAFLALSSTAGAQQVGSTDTVRPVGIYAGTCDAPGELAFELRDLVVGPDSRGNLEFVGSADASVVESSEDTELRTTVDSLTAAPHVVAVFESEQSETIIACGAIGGFMVSSDDDLVIGLRQVNDSGFAGVALLDGDDDDDEVDVDVYLARDAATAAA